MYCAFCIHTIGKHCSILLANLLSSISSKLLDFSAWSWVHALLELHVTCYACSIDTMVCMLRPNKMQTCSRCLSFRMQCVFVLLDICHSCCLSIGLYLQYRCCFYHWFTFRSESSSWHWLHCRRKAKYLKPCFVCTQQLYNKAVVDIILHLRHALPSHPSWPIGPHRLRT